MEKHIADEMSVDCKGAKVWFAKVSPMSSSSLGLPTDYVVKAIQGCALLFSPCNLGRSITLQDTESCLHPALIPEDAGSWDCLAVLPHPMLWAREMKPCS